MKKEVNLLEIQKLKDWRDKMGLSQPRAAAKLRVPLPTYRNWEQAISRIPDIVWAVIDGVK